MFGLLSCHVIAGFSQGVRRSVGGLATILGPLWAGGLTENMYIMMGVMMALLALLTVCKKKSHQKTLPVLSYHVCGRVNEMVLGGGLLLSAYSTM